MTQGPKWVLLMKKTEEKNLALLSPKIEAYTRLINWLAEFCEL
jgi:hypothetical protein